MEKGFPNRLHGLSQGPQSLESLVFSGSAEDRNRSIQLSEYLKYLILEAGGWIGFDRWMDVVLYHSEWGYYCAERSPIGPRGDFVTSPELSPVFGDCLAIQCKEWFRFVPNEVVEFGAGTGSLAAQILFRLDQENSLPEKYLIIERSPLVQLQQKKLLLEKVPDLLSRVVWMEDAPEVLKGIVLANEVLDAMPVRVFRSIGVQVMGAWQQKIFERGVAYDFDQERFLYSDKLAEPSFSELVKTCLGSEPWGNSTCRLDQYGSSLTTETPKRTRIVHQNIFEVDSPFEFTSEINQAAQEWLQTVGKKLKKGIFLLIDYGFPRHEFFHPQRKMGTLSCYYRHYVHYQALDWPGLQDITAHVDWTAMLDAASQIGLSPIGFTSQANFLLNCGILDRLSDLHKNSSHLAWVQHARAAHYLLSESEMGELFKVMAFERGVSGLNCSTGFSRGDRLESLLGIRSV